MGLYSHQFGTYTERQPEMEQIVGVRFKPAGKIYYFDGNDLELHLDDGVIVETSRGLEYGYVVTMPTEAEKDEENPMKPVIRRATIKDMAQLERSSKCMRIGAVI